MTALYPFVCYRAGAHADSQWLDPVTHSVPELLIVIINENLKDEAVRWGSLATFSVTYSSLMLLKVCTSYSLVLPTP